MKGLRFAHLWAFLPRKVGYLDHPHWDGLGAHEKTGFACVGCHNSYILIVSIPKLSIGCYPQEAWVSGVVTATLVSSITGRVYHALISSQVPNFHPLGRSQPQVEPVLGPPPPDPRLIAQRVLERLLNVHRLVLDRLPLTAIHAR